MGEQIRFMLIRCELERAVEARHDKITKRAYNLWIGKWCPKGPPAMDRFRTEAQLKGREPLPEAWSHSLRADECV